MFRPNDLTVQRERKPDAWRKRILRAIGASKTDEGAARILGVSLRTLRRWLAADPTLKRNSNVVENG